MVVAFSTGSFFLFQSFDAFDEIFAVTMYKVEASTRFTVSKTLEKFINL